MSGDIRKYQETSGNIRKYQELSGLQSWALAVFLTFSLNFRFQMIFFAFFYQVNLTVGGLLNIGLMQK